MDFTIDHGTICLSEFEVLKNLGAASSMPPSLSVKAFQIKQFQEV